MKRVLTSEQKAKRAEYHKKYREINREKLLLAKKADYIKNKNLRNKQARQWREVNTEKDKELKAKHYQNNKPLFKERSKEYRETNKDSLSKKSKIYYQSNKDKILNKVKTYNIENTEKVKTYQKEYHSNNQLKRNKTENNRYQTDILYRLKKNLRGSIYRTLRNKGFKKNIKTEQILGCSYEFFKSYLESKFDLWMNWGNQGNPKMKFLN